MVIEPDPIPWVNILFWVTFVFILLMCCICGAVIKGWI